MTIKGQVKGEESTGDAVWRKLCIDLQSKPKNLNIAVHELLSKHGPHNDGMLAINRQRFAVQGRHTKNKNTRIGLFPAGWKVTTTNKQKKGLIKFCKVGEFAKK